MSLIIKGDQQNIFKTQFTTLGSFIVFLLGATVLALAERILYDVARYFAVPPVDYFDNISVIIVQAGVIILILILALFANLSIGPKKEKYAIALFPYFLVSIFLALQLALQISVYFYNHHTDLEFYVVMILLIVICTYSIYHIQKRYIEG